MSEDRGQLVLVAAGVLAIALVPMGLAYLQLGYHGDVTAATDRADHLGDAERVLERVVHEAATDAAREPWGDRDAVARAVRIDLQRPVSGLEASRVAAGVVYDVAYNASAAATWAGDHCPRGDGRRFGPCTTDDGIVLQERAGESHVLAVAMDLTVTTERGERRVTRVVRTVGG